MDIFSELSRCLVDGKLQKDYLLKPFTTIKVGGPADYFLQTSNLEEFQNVLKRANELSLRTYILGGGSNIVFADEGFRGLIIRPSFRDFEIVSETSDEVVVRIGAGYVANLAAVKALELGFSGFEGLYGLPGSIGGAVFMNSKWPKSKYQIGEVVRSVRALNKKSFEIKLLNNSDLKFSYGYSTMQDNEDIFIDGLFVLKKSTVDEVQKRCDDVIKYRKVTQPTGVFTAGCVFKNVPAEVAQKAKVTISGAGYLIDQAGLKNTRIGGMSISSVHANFFINDGTGTAKDFFELKELVKDKVRSKFGIELKEEVLFVI